MGWTASVSVFASSRTISSFSPAFADAPGIFTVVLLPVWILLPLVVFCPNFPEFQSTGGIRYTFCRVSRWTCRVFQWLVGSLVVYAGSSKSRDRTSALLPLMVNSSLLFVGFMITQVHTFFQISASVSFLGVGLVLIPIFFVSLSRVTRSMEFRLQVFVRFYLLSLWPSCIFGQT